MWINDDFRNLLSINLDGLNRKFTAIHTYNISNIAKFCNINIELLNLLNNGVQVGVEPFGEDKVNYLIGKNDKQIAKINCIKPSWPSWNGYQSIKVWFFTGYIDVRAPKDNQNSYSFVRYQFNSVKSAKKNSKDNLY
jgi:hypothetical protein